MDEKVVLADLHNYDIDLVMEVLGTKDANLKAIAEAFNTELSYQDGYIMGKTGSDAIKKVFKELVDTYELKGEITPEDVNGLLHNASDATFFRKPIAKGVGSRQFYLRSPGQKELYEAFEKHDITIVTGPAGTGKTFLAVVYASNLLRQGLVQKVIITRPVVEAGESLGYLPGDLKEKIDPYLRPIYDSFEQLFGTNAVEKMIEKDVLELAPLAYMRGRTLNDAIVILDEAQNTTAMQIKMFMTRLGFNSKMIITGDVTQIDLPANRPSGLLEAIDIVKGIKEIAVVQMTRNDVVRHPVVQKIIDAYEKKE